jgi:hypothetical protein
VVKVPDGLPYYRLLTGPDDDDFCRRVSDALTMGYELYGSPSVTWGDGGTVVAAQALVWAPSDDRPSPLGQATSHDAAYTWGDGCHGWRLVDEPDLSVIEEWLPTGARERLHRHMRSLQLYYVLGGDALVSRDGHQRQLGRGDSMAIAAGAEHLIANVGEVPLRLLVISSPSTDRDRQDLG